MQNFRFLFLVSALMGVLTACQTSQPVGGDFATFAPVPATQFSADLSALQTAIASYDALVPAPVADVTVADAAVISATGAIVAVTTQPTPVPPPPVPPSAQPNASNTGPRVPVTAWTAGRTFTTAQTITGKKFTGQINVELPGNGVLTLIDCILDGNNAYYNFYVYSGAIVCTHCDIQNAQASVSMGSNVTLNECDLHNFKADAAHLGSNVHLFGNFINDYGHTAAAHADGAQAVSGTGIIIQGNTFDATKASGWNNSCIFLNGSGGPITGPVIDHNWFLGGSNYAIYLRGGQSGAVITNNVFYTGKTVWQFGILSNPSGMTRPAVWRGNADQNGTSLPLPAAVADGVAN